MSVTLNERWIQKPSKLAGPSSIAFGTGTLRAGTSAMVFRPQASVLGEFRSATGSGRGAADSKAWV